MKTVIKSSSIALMYALLTTVALATYFILMRVLGLAENTTLRVFNFAILFAGVFKSISSFKDFSGHDFTYFRGLIMGVKTGLFIALLFTVLILIYYMFDAPFVNRVLLEGHISGYNSIFALVGVLFIEVLGFTCLGSFMSMQYLKNAKHVLPKAVH